MKYENKLRKAQVGTNPSNKLDKKYSSSGEKVICWDFSNGWCSYGRGCKFHHIIANQDKHPTKNANTNDLQRLSQTQPRHPRSRLQDHEENPKKDSKPMCPNYQYGRCNNFDECKILHYHPRRCRDMMTFGECRSGDSCAYFHPQICNNSINNLICTVPECPYFHLQWTKRHAEARRNKLYDDTPMNHIEKVFNQGKTDQVYEPSRDKELENTTQQTSSYENSFLLDQIKETNAVVKQLQTIISSSLGLQAPHQFVQYPAELQVTNPSHSVPISSDMELQNQTAVPPQSIAQYHNLPYHSQQTPQQYQMLPHLYEPLSQENYATPNQNMQEVQHQNLQGPVQTAY